MGGDKRSFVVVAAEFIRRRNQCAGEKIAKRKLFAFHLTGEVAFEPEVNSAHHKVCAQSTDVSSDAEIALRQSKCFSKWMLSISVSKDTDFCIKAHQHLTV